MEDAWVFFPAHITQTARLILLKLFKITLHFEPDIICEWPVSSPSNANYVIEKNWQC